MAITNDDEDKINMGGGYVGGYDQGGNAPTPEAPKTSSQGSGFINIENYLSGNNGSAAMAGSLVNGLNDAGNKAKGDIATFGNDVVTATQVPDFNPSSTTQPVGYSGPAGYSDFGSFKTAQASTSDVKQKSDLLGTQEGVQNELTKMAPGSVNYTGGMSRLDTNITRSGEGGKILDAARKNWGTIDSWLGNASVDAQGKIDSAKTKSQSLNDQWAKSQQQQQQAQAQAAITADYNKKQAETQAAQKKTQDELAKRIKDQQDKAAQAENEVWTKQYFDRNSGRNERSAWIGSLKPGGLRDGWLWSQQDIDNYIATGQKPNRAKVTSSGTYSTPEGDF